MLPPVASYWFPLLFEIATVPRKLLFRNSARSLICYVAHSLIIESNVSIIFAGTWAAGGVRRAPPPVGMCVR